MRVIIAGSRDVSEAYENVVHAIQESKFPITHVISGNARGVDWAGERCAKEWNYSLVIFPANWNRFKKAAGAIRNEEMGNYADALIAIWDGESRGTKHMIEYMMKLNKPVEIHTIKKETN